jgi:hypothetical protein
MENREKLRSNSCWTPIPANMAASSWMLVLLRGVLEERRLCSAIFSHVQPLAQRVRETSIGATCKEPAEKGDEANGIVSGHKTTKARARRSTRGISKDYYVSCPMELFMHDIMLPECVLGT